MRYCIAAVALVLGFVCSANASPVQFTFQGTFSNSYGNINAGDGFSGAAVWDTSAVGANSSYPTFALLEGFMLTLPSGDGLSVPGIPNATVSFAGANYTSATSGVFEDLQINETVSGTHYVFIFGSVSPGCSPHCNAEVANASFTVNDFAATYSVQGPTSIPEPVSGSTMAMAFGLMWALRARQKKLKPKGLIHSDPASSSTR